MMYQVGIIRQDIELPWTKYEYSACLGGGVEKSAIRGAAVVWSLFAVAVRF